MGGYFYIRGVIMEGSFTIFDHKSMNDELIEEFENFFHKYNLDGLFTNEHRTPPISVSDLDLRSVVNPGGKYHSVFLEFTDYLNFAQDNQMYEDIMFFFINKPRSLKGLVNQVKQAMRYIDGIDQEHLFNQWNIVWYNRYDLK